MAGDSQVDRPPPVATRRSLIWSLENKDILSGGFNSIASSNKCLTCSNKKLLGTSASLLVTSALLVVTRNTHWRETTNVLAAWGCH